MKLPALKEIVDERKEKAIESLSTSYAKNKLPLEEYERLVEYINKIESERELIVVEKMVSEYDGIQGSAPEEPAAKTPVYDDEDEDDYHPSYDKRQSYTPGNLAVLSTRMFSGPLRSGTQFVSILGSGQIRIRKSDLSKNKTEINIVSILGDSVILVEPGIRV